MTGSPPMATAVPIGPITSLPTPLAPAAPTKKTPSLYRLPSKPNAANGFDPSDRTTSILTDNQVSRLREQGFPRGLATSLADTKTELQYRIWVVDNSGSMNSGDGHRMVDTLDPNSVRMVSATRWEEIRECVHYHARMADLLDTPATFRLLNNPGKHAGPQQFGVAEAPGQDANEAITIMNKVRPGGATPLTQHVKEIHESITGMLDELTETGRRVAIIIATDGLPSDWHGVSGPVQQRAFVDSLRLLEGLPVWVVVRLCTDDNEVVEFYNDLDEQLEMSLEVLDDFSGEAEEIHAVNPWLNYALPLHRCREMGYHHRVFDLIDERKLTKGELRDFCQLLFGSDQFDGVPDPDLDWDGFSSRLRAIVNQEKQQWVSESIVMCTNTILVTL